MKKKIVYWLCERGRFKMARQLSTTSGLTNGSGVYRLWLLSANTPRRAVVLRLQV